MNPVRYIVCGAATGYLVLAEIAGLLLETAGVMGLLMIPVGMIGGGFCGYLYAKTKQTRRDRVVHVLPERTQGSTRATAA